MLVSKLYIFLFKQNLGSNNIICFFFFFSFARWLREKKKLDIYVEPRVRVDLLTESSYFNFVQTWKDGEQWSFSKWKTLHNYCWFDILLILLLDLFFHVVIKLLFGLDVINWNFCFFLHPILHMKLKCFSQCYFYHSHGCSHWLILYSNFEGIRVCLCSSFVCFVLFKLSIYYMDLVRCCKKTTAHLL